MGSYGKVPYAEWGLRDLSIVATFTAFFTFVSKMVAQSEEAPGSGCHTISFRFPIAEWPFGRLHSWRPCTSIPCCWAGQKRHEARRTYRDLPTTSPPPQSLQLCVCTYLHWEQGQFQVSFFRHCLPWVCLFIFTAWCLQEPEEGIVSPGTGVTESF